MVNVPLKGVKLFQAQCALIWLTLAAAAQTGDASKGYTNDVWVMTEGEILVTDPDGQPVDLHTKWRHRVGHVRLRIIWTDNIDYGWNYTTNATPRKEGSPASMRSFLEEHLAGRTVVWTDIPRTPFKWATINGRFAAVVWDTAKDVLWKLEGLDQAVGKSDTIKVLDRQVTLSTSGGDMATFIKLDFSGGASGIRVQYWERHDGP
jgi:hypothetical protein